MVTEQQIQALAVKLLVGLCADPQCDDPVRASFYIAKQFLEECQRRRNGAR